MTIKTLKKQVFCLTLLILVIMLHCPVNLVAQLDPFLQIKVDVVYLASDDLEGRETGTQGEALAAEYIQQRMYKLGLKPKGSDGWFQEFKFASNPHEMKNQDKTGMNVLGFLDNKSKKTLIIGAHYDHLGHGASGSLSPNDHSIHNGADDNASGVAGLLWLAQQSVEIKKWPFNILFIAFSGEEAGLFGSKAFMENPTIPKEKIIGMINLDMVGRLNAEKTIAISGVGTSSEWKELLEKSKPADFQFNYSDGGIGPSDHTSFYLKDIPVLHFFTGQHKDYHKPGDDSPLVNYTGIQQVSRIIFSLVSHLAKNPILSFQKTKDDNKQQVSSFKVTLGVMPDYVYNGEGMRIDAILDGRPAQKAGLEAGDIVIKLGESPIKDIYEYMAALGKYEKGQSADILVKRKDQVLLKKVEF
jgi:hypothetical protein